MTFTTPEAFRASLDARIRFGDRVIAKGGAVLEELGTHLRPRAVA